jgi:hypothetical protein
MFPLYTLLFADINLIRPKSKYPFYVNYATYNLYVTKPTVNMWMCVISRMLEEFFTASFLVQTESENERDTDRIFRQIVGSVPFAFRGLQLRRHSRSTNMAGENVCGLSRPRLICWDSVIKLTMKLSLAAIHDTQLSRLYKRSNTSYANK